MRLLQVARTTLKQTLHVMVSLFARGLGVSTGGSISGGAIRTIMVGGSIGILVVVATIAEEQPELKLRMEFFVA